MSKNLFERGHSACAGCGVAIAVKIVIETLGKNTIAVMPPNCLSVFTIVPYANLKIPAILSLFASTASMVSGISAYFKQKNKKVNVIALAGDGGTADIGLQSLSAAIHRQHDFIYFCLNNQAYMNTGNQKSSLTPEGVNTTYGPSDRKPKDMFKIVCAHDIAYAATTSIGYPYDLINKIRKAINIEGPKYIEILTPCPSGWGFDSRYIVKISKMAVDCGFYKLEEFENGKLTKRKQVSHESKDNFFALQKRFRKSGDRK